MSEDQAEAVKSLQEIIRCIREGHYGRGMQFHAELVAEDLRGIADLIEDAPRLSVLISEEQIAYASAAEE